MFSAVVEAMLFYLKLLKSMVRSYKSAFESNISASQKVEANGDPLAHIVKWLLLITPLTPPGWGLLTRENESRGVNAGWS